MNTQGNTKTFFLGLQHVLAMYAGSVIVPLIVGSSLKLSNEQVAYLIAADLLTCGLATLLQFWRNKFSGIGLPVVLGCSFTAVSPIINIGINDGMGAIYGSILCSGIFICIIASFFSKLKRFFPPVVTGSIVTIIGGSLVSVGINNFAGGLGSPDFGQLSNLALGFFVLIFILAVNRFLTGYARAISVLLGLAVGTFVGACTGMVDFKPVAEASWFNIVVPFYFGTPTFHIGGILTMIIVAIVSMVESTGVFLVLGEICGREIKEEDLTKGYRAEGLAAILGSLFNSFPYTTFSQNVGLIQLSKVKRTNVVIVAGGILITLGMLPKFAALATIIPNPVLGGAMLIMFGMVMATGIKMLSKVALSNNNNLLIIACSVAMGIGVSTVPGFFAKLPPILRIMLESGIVTGAITAIILNLLLGTSADDTIEDLELI